MLSRHLFLIILDVLDVVSQGRIRAGFRWIVFEIRILILLISVGPFYRKFLIEPLIYNGIDN